MQNPLAEVICLFVSTVEVPVSLLLDPALTPAAKVLWLAVRAHYQPAPPAKKRSRGKGSGVSGSKAQPNAQSRQAVLTLANLAAATWLNPVTVRRAQAQLEATGWYARATVRELAEAGWLTLNQAHQLAPIQFALRNPGQAEVDDAELRLQENQYSPEQIMKEYLSLLIDCDHYEDNARPGFLTNPLTGYPMELDRYYPGVVGFEFNGLQHYQETELQPSENRLRMQKARDLMKEALCARHGIKFVVIHRADLTLQTMKQKVGALLPLRDLRGHEALVAYLEKVSEANRT